MKLLFTSQSPPLLNHISNFHLRRSFPANFRQKGKTLAATARWRIVALAAARPEKEESSPEAEKCEGFAPEVESMTAEELEKIEEAVMEGKDEGREPLDYDRRARIFYQSSRVFSDVNKD